jgi:hypothetical protein
MSDGDAFHLTNDDIILRMAHTVELDQSGKIEATNEDTILALARDADDSYAVLVPATLKRYLIKSLRKKYAKPQILYLRIFCASMFLLLRGYGLAKLSTVIIDTEYWGHEAEIKGELLNFIRQLEPDFPKDAIVFTQIGKQSHAHVAALATFRGERATDFIARLEDYSELLGV